MIQNRNLDGVYFRIQRDGKWENICFSDLTPEERIEVMKDRGEGWLKSLCCILADTIRNIGDEMSLVGEL